MTFPKQSEAKNPSASTSDLNLDDIEVLIESLQYTKRNLEATKYPTVDFRRQALDRVDKLVSKLRRIKKLVK